MTTHKHLSILSLILILLSLILTGCSGSNNPEDEPARAASGALKVAMLLPSPANDKGWSQAGFEGLKLIEKELGAQVAYTENVVEADAEKVLRQYADEGYDFIIGQGGEYITGAEVVAEVYPRTKFAVVAGYAGNNKNFGALSFRDGEVGYLTGAVAALKTKSNKVAYIGGEAYPHMLEQATLFERGAKATNPAVEVSVVWIESWSDQDKAKSAAKKQIEAGVDVFVVDADTAGLAALEEAKKAGTYAIGWSLDQHELAPEVILTSAIQRVPILLLEGATLVQQGRWEGKQYKFGLQEGAQDLAPFYGLLTGEEEAKISAVRAEILAGKIDTTP
ncbi:MAG: BMP family ABC transporter substrate-binding protein [Anaerolineales bacterium]|nr:BMP family ABC transporter substrate-binding protein [Anaerolineales bacterium]